MKSFVVKVEELFKLSERSSAGDNLFQKDICNLRIPLYQREYKWDRLRVSELLEDVISKQKLLGIVLLDENKTEGVYDIVDGQQRVTTLLFILMELYNRLSSSPLDQKTVYEVIYNGKEFVLKNNSFGSNYIIQEGGQLRVEIKEDIYYQIPVVEGAFQAIKECLDLTQEKYTDIVRNILKCQFVVIVNKDAAGAFQDPVEQIFLDINEKSQQLDAEDIFKGHCFKNFDGAHIDIVKKDWENLKASGMEFCKKFMKDESIDKFLYHYLLIREGNTITDKLTCNGKHYMNGKNQSETHAILENISLAANTIIGFHKKLLDENYRLEDLSNDIKSHKEEKEIKTCRILLKEILELKTADFPKFPTYYFLYKLQTESELNDKFTAADIREIVSNLYIYAFVFAYTEGRKGKKDINYDINNAFKSDEKTIVNNVKTASRKMRKTTIDGFVFKEDIKKYNVLAFYYSILDFYDLKKIAFYDKYVSKNDTNLEHFIMPDTNGILWYRDKDKKKNAKILADNEFFKMAKKYTINYLIIPEELNRNMGSVDIVKKIEMIREWYKPKKLPRHVEVIITNIENMDSYKQLKVLKESGEMDNSIIQNSYISFWDDYFSEEHNKALCDELWTDIKKCFI